MESKVGEFDPNRTFVRTLGASESSQGLFAELGEIALDSVITEGVLRDIPILGTALSLMRAGNDVSAYLFTKKILNFLGEIEVVDVRKRKEFLKAECSENEGVSKAGEATLMILDKLDSLVSAQMLGRAFALMMEGRLTRRDFDLYSHVIKNLNSYLVAQIHQCFKFENACPVDEPAANLLSNLGILDVSVQLNRSGDTRLMPKNVVKTAFGKDFYEQIV